MLPESPKKKRARVVEDVGREEEDEDRERSSKKRRGNIVVEGMGGSVANKIMKEKMAPKSQIPSPAKRAGGLSLSRLKMLAMPKSRR